MAPWWLRASDDEQLADSPAELEVFAQEEDPVLAAPAEEVSAAVLAAEPDEDDAGVAAAESDEGDELGDSEDLETPGDAKSGGVRRRRRRRRGRRGGDGAAAAAAEAPTVGPLEADAVPLFDSPPSLAPAAAERAPLLAPAASVPAEPASFEPTAFEQAPELAAEPAVFAAAAPPVEEPAPAHSGHSWHRAPAVPAASDLGSGAAGTSQVQAGQVKTEPFRLFVPPVSSVEPALPARQPEPPVSPPAAASFGDASEAASRPSGRRSSPARPAAPPPAPPRPPRAPEPRAEHGYAASDLGALQMEPLPKAYVYAVPERPTSPADERKIAMFVDFENIALGVRDSEVRTFDMTLILERLLEKGKIIVKKAYADWERYSEYKRPFHEAAIELIDIPQKFYSGKNSADIKMVVDAMDLCYSKEHLDTFVLVSGDSDFSPLVSKLKENNKYVIGLGVKNSSSSLLIDNCDEFIYYEDVWRDTQRVPRLDHLAPKEAECFQLMCESIVALLRENKEVLWGSLVKQTMQRKRPSFSEGYYGYGTFTELLEDAERKNIIRLRRDQRSGTYIVVGFVPPRSKRSFQV